MVSAGFVFCAGDLYPGNESKEQFCADRQRNPKDEIFNPITSVMNDEMTVEEWAQNVEDAFAQIRADQEAAK